MTYIQDKAEGSVDKQFTDLAETIVANDEYLTKAVLSADLAATTRLMEEMQSMGNWTSERVAKTAGRHLLK